MVVIKGLRLLLRLQRRRRVCGLGSRAALSQEVDPGWQVPLGRLLWVLWGLQLWDYVSRSPEASGAPMPSRVRRADLQLERLGLWQEHRAAAWLRVTPREVLQRPSTCDCEVLWSKYCGPTRCALHPGP